MADDIADPAPKRGAGPAGSPERAPGPPPPESLLPLEIAMGAAHDDPSLDSPARLLLQDQRRLVAEQIHLARNERLRNRIKAARDLALAAAVVLLVAAAGGLMWDAWRDRSLVIQAFSVPPEMAARGLTGQVVSGQLLDRIAAIDARAQSFRAPETFRNDWAGDIQLEIPDTGVSIGELDRYLRATIGDRTVIAGELFRDPKGLALTVRAGSGVALTVRGTDAELDAMLARAAEGVFAQTQPFRYSKYLEYTGRTEEAMTAARALALDGPLDERPWAWAQISNLLYYQGDFAGAAAAGRRAVTLDPEQVLGWVNRRNAALVLGREAEAYRSLGRAVELSGRGGLSDAARRASYVGDSWLKATVRDHAGALATIRSAPELDYPLEPGHWVLEAIQLAFLHEVSAARRIGGAQPDPGVPGTSGEMLSLNYFAAAGIGDWAAAAAALEAAATASQAHGRAGAAARERFIRPRLAHAYAMLGRPAEARALLQGTPSDCYRCLRLQAQALAALGDAAGAEWAFAAAVRQAPALPSAYGEWAQARFARGDLDGALRLAGKARERGPRWAEPLKLEGEILLRQGEASAAVRKFEAAAERAPRWGELHLLWGRALERQGEREQAQAMYRKAAGMDLSAADRAEVRRRLGSAA